MMRSLWTAASGMIGQQTALDVTANNLSNINILDRHPDLLAYLIYTDSLGNYAVYDGLGQVISDK